MITSTHTHTYQYEYCNKKNGFNNYGFRSNQSRPYLGNTLGSATETETSSLSLYLSDGTVKTESNLPYRTNMGKGPNKKRNKTTKRGKGCYQSTDDGEEQPPSIGRRCQKSNKRRDNNQQQKNGNYNRGDNDYDTDDCKKLRKTLNADGLEIVEMSADGNCLFRSLSDQLFGDYGKMHYDVRAVVCDFMEQNKADFQVFLVFEDEDDEDQCEEDARDFDHYVGNMREQGQWGGNLEVVAAARLYR